MQEKLPILGAGRYGMVAKEIAEAMGIFSDIAFLDDDSSIAIGRLNEYEKFVNDYDFAIVAIGNVALRLELLDKLEESGYCILVLIHSAAYVAQSAVIGCGCFIEPMAVVHTGAVIEKGCIISAGTIVNHNSKIGEGCHLNCGTIVASNCEVQGQTKTQCGARII